MLGNFIRVDDHTYPLPSEGGFTETPENLETINLSEASTELDSIQWLGKYNATMIFRVSSYWKRIINQDCLKPFVTLHIKNASHIGRLRLLSCILVDDTFNNTESDGYWDMTIQFTESKHD